MNKSIAALQEFITDFELLQPDGVIFFKAIIHLLINGNMQVQKSEVHIITSDGLATVYINDLDSSFFQLPQLFEAKKQDFTYVPGKCLKIEGAAGPGNFVLSILPGEKNKLL